MRALQARTARNIPFYYGWVILGLTGIASYSSRPLMSVAVLTVFVVPMEESFGWSRTQVAGAVSLGGVFAVVLSPLVGPLIDRYGSGLVVGVSSGIAGICAIGLGMVNQVWLFYLIYVPGRAAFASPLELGTSTAVSNWFIRRRPFALAMNHVLQGSGLAVMPLAAQVMIGVWSWPVAWYALGIWTLAIGVAPAILLMGRRPEDLALLPDGDRPVPNSGTAPGGRRPQTSADEINFTSRQAMRTRAFWLMMLFAFAGFIAQAGVSLHQVPHFIDQGVPGSIAVWTASTFAISQVPASLLWSALCQRFPLVVSGGAVVTAFADNIVHSGGRAAHLQPVGLGRLFRPAASGRDTGLGSAANGSRAGVGAVVTAFAGATPCGRRQPGAWSFC